jgi:hypothetical protein
MATGKIKVISSHVGAIYGLIHGEIHACITGTFGICTIYFKITHILDNSRIFILGATIEIMQSTTKS